MRESMENGKKFKTRTFVSISMFLFIMLLALTGITIQAVESLAGSDEPVPAPLYFLLHFATAVHVLSGFSFAALSVFILYLTGPDLKTIFGEKSRARTKNSFFPSC
jgi:hypothetical protein